MVPGRHATLRIVATRRLPRPAYLAIGYVLTSRPFTVWHRWIYRRTDGRGILARALGMDMILVTVRGRRSGELRTVPLGAIRHDDDWIVIGSNAGKDRAPAWVHNLRSASTAGPGDPAGAITVEHRGVARPHVVHEAVEDEAANLWPIVIEAYPGYGIYRDRTERSVPLFVLSPVEAG
jgi:deazaflavin-dependent oxidoreductase (nitroreductase family)